ncbi:MAG TPA: nucleotidyltransferase domain-containing protein [archaeon]|nr:nucleotidyltransferase domain-containing protein [archaeon]
MNKIEEMIFRTPEKWVHIREIARRLRVSPNSVRKEAALLKRCGILKEKTEGNMIQYRANMESERYKREKMLHNLRSIFDSGIVDFLYEYYNPSAIVLFGSYSRGEDTSTSDIDIAVVTSSKKRPDLKKFEKKLSRRIELSLFIRKEVSKEFFNNIINGIVLRGFLKYE